MGFDLDMTLVDSSKAILVTTQTVLKGFNVEVSEQVIRHSVGLPIKESFKKWIGDGYLQAYELYVAHYQSTGYLESQALPGARELLLDLLRQGIKVVVITAKNQQSAEIQLRHLLIPFSEIVGDAFQGGKTAAIKNTSCLEYVGDHVEDYKAAADAGIHFIGVATNPMQELESESNGSFQVMKTLSDFWDYSILK